MILCWAISNSQYEYELGVVWKGQYESLNMFWTPTLIIQGFHRCGARQPENMGTEVKALYQTVARQPPTQRQGALIWPNGTGRLQKVGVANDPRKVGHFYQMLYLGYEWIRSWFGSKTYPIKRKPCCFRLVVDASTAWPPGKGGVLHTIAHKPRSNWTIQQSIISLNSRVYLSQSHLFHMFFNWRIRSLQLPLLNIPHCDILMFHPCPRWDELPVCTPLCNVDSLRHQPGMRILQALTVKRQFYTLQRYSQLSRQLLGDDSGIYLMNHHMDTISRVWFYISHWT